MNSSAPRSHTRRLGLFAALASFPFLASLSLANYQLDDGVPSVGIRISVPGVIVNQFTALAGQETITGVEIVFDGAPETGGQPLNLVVYSDPTNDGIFNDAVLVYSQADLLPEVPTTAPQSFHFVTGITFNPGDVFYVGYEQLVVGSYAVLRDSAAAGGTRTWASFDGPSPTDPLDGGTTSTLAGFGFPQNAMIRALTTSAIPEPASASALAGAAILVGAALRRRR